MTAALREAAPGDVPMLLDLIKELAAYERQPDAVKMTGEQLHEALFGARPRAEALLAEAGGVPQGFAIWFESFNTWTGHPGLHVEDVFVREAARGQRIGRAIFHYLARLAVSRGYQRIDWQVLDWNVAAIRFYQSLGAAPQTEWHRYRLSGDALTTLAGA